MKAMELSWHKSSVKPPSTPLATPIAGRKIMVDIASIVIAVLACVGAIGAAALAGWWPYFRWAQASFRSRKVGFEISWSSPARCPRLTVQTIQHHRSTCYQLHQNPGEKKDNLLVYTSFLVGHICPGHTSFAVKHNSCVLLLTKTTKNSVRSWARFAMHSSQMQLVLKALRSCCGKAISRLWVKLWRFWRGTNISAWAMPLFMRNGRKMRCFEMVSLIGRWRYANCGGEGRWRGVSTRSEVETLTASACGPNSSFGS